jgi:MFS family permease
LGSKYLQQTLGYAPHQAVLIMLPGGVVALGLNILTGRVSDLLGRKRTVLITATLAGICYTIFYSGLHGAAIPPIWVLAFYGFFATDALFAGYTTEIMPTAYRATVSGLRYMVEIMMGGLSLGLEGVFYDRFGAHGPAISIFLLTIPIALIAVLFLPEPAGRKLEEISAA